MVLKFDKMAGGRKNAPFEAQGVAEWRFKPRQMKEQGLLVLEKFLLIGFLKLYSTTFSFECRQTPGHGSSARL